MRKLIQKVGNQLIHKGLLPILQYSPHKVNIWAMNFLHWYYFKFLIYLDDFVEDSKIILNYFYKYPLPTAVIAARSYWAIRKELFKLLPLNFPH